MLVPERSAGPGDAPGRAGDPRFDCREHLPQLEALAGRYADRQPDLADLCLIRMSELNPRHSVITVDRKDFWVFRRNKRETIPLISPPGP